jgi:predicted lipoprotein
VAAALFVGLLPIAPAHAAGEAEYAAVVKSAVSDYILPGYERLELQTGMLVGALDAFCGEATEPNRHVVEEAFAQTVKAWAEVDFFRFGPMAEDGRYERFAFFPDVHGTGARQLRRFLATENEKLLQAGALAGQSAAVQGLPALEALIYSGSKALAEADTVEPYRCELARAVAANMHAIAGEALARWRGEGGWAALIGNPGADNPVYRSHSEAMTEVLKVILTGLEQMRDHRLVPALGATPEEAKASRAPYNASGQALPYLAASAAAIGRFVEVSDVAGLLPPDKDWVGRSARFEFSNLRSAIEAAGPDLAAALADNDKREKLVYAAIVLKSLRDLFQQHLGPAAGLTAGFNSLDGD